MKLVRYADRPDLHARRFEEMTEPTFPEYMNHNEPGRLYWDRLVTDFPDFQVALVDGDELLAEAHAIPLPWDGTLEDLPSGWDAGFLRAMESGPACRPRRNGRVGVDVRSGSQQCLAHLRKYG